MKLGTVQYIPASGAAGESLKLTLVGNADDETLARGGVGLLRQERILRLTGEASRQGRLLGYGDLASLLNSSLATIKRDVLMLEALGHNVRIRGRRRKRSNPSALENSAQW